MNAKTGDLVAAAGEDCDKAKVVELYLTDGTNDHKVVIIEQSAQAIKFKVPATKPGRYALMIKTGGSDAKLLEQPVIPFATDGPQPKPRALAVIQEDSCIGCTLCIQACPVDAIIGAAKLMHTVIAAECTGCELCVAPCPVDCIDLVPVNVVKAAADGALLPLIVFAVGFGLALTRIEAQRRGPGARCAPSEDH